MTHICVGKLAITVSGNGLSPGWHQAIIWTNAGIFLIWTLGTNFSEILIEIHIFSFKKMHLKLSSAKWHPFCLGLTVLTLNVRGQSHLGLTRSISWLLMPWLLMSPGHQQPCYWLCRIGRFLSYLRKDFNNLRRINVEGDMTQNVNICLCSLKNLARKGLMTADTGVIGFMLKKNYPAV